MSDIGNIDKSKWLLKHAYLFVSSNLPAELFLRSYGRMNCWNLKIATKNRPLRFSTFFTRLKILIFNYWRYDCWGLTRIREIFVVIGCHAWRCAKVSKFNDPIHRKSTNWQDNQPISRSHLATCWCPSICHVVMYQANCWLSISYRNSKIGCHKENEKI